VVGKFTRVLGFSTFRVGGSTLWCRARAILITLATPAVHLVCPIIDLTDPIPQLWRAAPAALNTRLKEATSA
jgi:hypothetical protein